MRGGQRVELGHTLKKRSWGMSGGSVGEGDDVRVAVVGSNHGEVIHFRALFCTILPIGYPTMLRPPFAASTLSPCTLSTRIFSAHSSMIQMAGNVIPGFTLRSPRFCLAMCTFAADSLTLSIVRHGPSPPPAAGIILQDGSCSR